MNFFSCKLYTWNRTYTPAAISARYGAVICSLITKSPNLPKLPIGGERVVLDEMRQFFKTRGYPDYIVNLGRPNVLNVRAQDAKFALSFKTSAKFCDPGDLLKWLIVLLVPLLMLFIAQKALYANLYTLRQQGPVWRTSRVSSTTRMHPNQSLDTLIYLTLTNTW